MFQGTVYGLIDPRDDSLRYIGQTQGNLPRRLSGHICDARRRGHSRHVLQWIRGLLKEALKPQIRELAKASSLEELNCLEVRLIAEARTLKTRLTNHADGGDGTPGRPLTAAHKAKLHSPEVLARMAATRKGQPSPRKGVVLSAETRRKISLGKRGNRCRFKADVSTTEMHRLRAEGWSFERIGAVLGVCKKTVIRRLRKATT